MSTATAAIRTSRPRRLTLAEVAILVAVAAIIFVAAVWPALFHPAAAGTSSASVRVAANQTLWAIASAHRGADMSTAETVEWIKRTNGMQTSVVREGALLQVPAAPADTATAWLTH